MNRDRGSTTGGAGGGRGTGGSGLDLEALLRLGDPEERGWVAPDFDLIRARAVALAPAAVGGKGQEALTSSSGARRRQALTWMLAAAAAVVAVALVVRVVLPSLPRVGVGGQPSGSPTPNVTATASAAPTPTLSAADLAAVAQALGVPEDRVLATEDGAVAVRLNDGSLMLELAARDPAASRGWTMRSIAHEPAGDKGATSIDAIACDDPGRIRPIFVFGQVPPDTNGPLTIGLIPPLIRPGPSSTSGTAGARLGHASPLPVDALGGGIADGLYVFAIKGPIPGVLQLAVTGPDLQHAPISEYGVVTQLASRSCAS